MSRCDFTDLDTAMCAHCLGHKEPARIVRPDAAGPRVAAQYPGRCAGCGERFAPGTQIRAANDGWLADCCAS